MTQLDQGAHSPTSTVALLLAAKATKSADFMLF